MYYTYAYLREDLTPYYVGKGKGKRAYAAHNVPVPPTDRILYLKQNLTDEEAIRHEIYMISVLGRKDNGTGILRNLTDGGDGASGYTHTEEHKQHMSVSNPMKRPEVRDKFRKPRPDGVRQQISKSHCKYLWTFTSPSGEVFNTTNGKTFCIDKGFDFSTICSIFRGKCKTYKGWSVSRVSIE